MEQTCNTCKLFYPDEDNKAIGRCHLFAAVTTGAMSFCSKWEKADEKK